MTDKEQKEEWLKNPIKYKTEFEIFNKGYKPNYKEIDRDNDCFAVKSKDDLYFCGYNHWNKQLRKAKLYHWYRMAKEIAEDIRFMEYEPYIVHVTIIENGVADYEN